MNEKASIQTNLNNDQHEDHILGRMTMNTVFDESGQEDNLADHYQRTSYQKDKSIDLMQLQNVPKYILLYQR